MPEPAVYLEQANLGDTGHGGCITGTQAAVQGHSGG